MVGDKNAGQVEDRVLNQLNKAVLEHLELAGFSKIAKMLKDDIAKGPPNTGAGQQKVQSARGMRKDA